MAHAEKCPVCSGSGKLPGDTGTTDCTPKTCHGCNGRGWIVIGFESAPYVPQPYYPINPQPWPEPDYWHPYSPNYPPYEPWWGSTTISPGHITISGTTYQFPDGAQVYYT